MRRLEKQKWLEKLIDCTELDLRILEQEYRRGNQLYKYKTVREFRAFNVLIKAYLGTIDLED